MRVSLQQKLQIQLERDHKRKQAHVKRLCRASNKRYWKKLLRTETSDQRRDRIEHARLRKAKSLGKEPVLNPDLVWLKEVYKQEQQYSMRSIRPMHSSLHPYLWRYHASV